MFETLSRIAKSKLRNLWYQILMSRISDVVHVLRLYYGPKSTNLATLGRDIIPKKITGFHDLSYLFGCHQASRGIIALDFDEAAYLWKTITEKKPNTILEIGRWLGGSTILLCSAASQYTGGKIISIDLKVKTPDYAKDSLLEEHLQRLGLNNYKLYIASSFDYDPGEEINLAFIDGDHSYGGVKKDFENVRKYLSKGGDIIFHDSCETRPFATRHDAIATLMGEIEKDKDFLLIRQVGSLSHFRSLEKNRVKSLTD